MGSKRKRMSRVNKSQSKILPNPFLNFIRDFRKEMQGQNIPMVRMVQLAGQRWREMTHEQRLPYIELAEQARNSRKTKRGFRRARRGGKMRKGKRYRRAHQKEPRDAVKRPYRRRGSNYSGSSRSRSYSSDTSGSSQL